MMDEQTLDHFAATCSHAGDTHELRLIIADFLTAKGVRRFSYHSHHQIRSPAATARELIDTAVYGFPEPWVEYYTKHKVQQYDPVLKAAQVLGRPFWWSETSKLISLSPKQAAYLKEAAKWTFGDGLAMQTFGPKLRNGYVSLVFAKNMPRPSQHAIFAFQCAAQIAHLRYCALTEEHERQLSALSPRECDVLTWIAKGKSNSVIAQILDISPHTVDTLTRRIFEKLEVTDRTTAAIRGLYTGWLTYP